MGGGQVAADGTTALPGEGGLSPLLMDFKANLRLLKQTKAMERRQALCRVS